LADKRTSVFIAGEFQTACGGLIRAWGISGSFRDREEHGVKRRQMPAGTVLSASVTTELCT
jgi:hypothetical protein